LAVGEPGPWESLIPVWGAARSSVNDFQQGDYLWGAVNAALAVSDVALVKSFATAAGKGLFKLGSHTWPATSKWLTKVGWREFRGQEMHHWLIPQRRWGKGIPNVVKNQPYNLLAMRSAAFHAAVEGRGGEPFSLLERLWHGSPSWFKLLLVNGIGHEASFSHCLHAGGCDGN
jgi:hypothetical protein